MNDLIFENDAYILTELEPNLYHWHFKDVELQLNDYMEVYNLGMKKYKEEGVKANIINTHDLTFSFASETWDFIVDKNSDFSFVNCQAVVVKQLHLRVLARIIASIRKKSYLFKVFSNYDDALSWVKSKM